jgi:hypothetical protein
MSSHMKGKRIALPQDPMEDQVHEANIDEEPSHVSIEDQMNTLTIWRRMQIFCLWNNHV